MPYGGADAIHHHKAKANHPPPQHLLQNQSRVFTNIWADLDLEPGANRETQDQQGGQDRDLHSH